MKKKTKMLMAALLSVTMILGACGGSAGPGNSGNSGTSAVQGTTSGKEQKKDSSDGGNMAGKYKIFRFGEGETAVDGDLLVASGMDVSYLELKSDHTGVFNLSGTETPIEWNEKGEISTSGVKLYTFTVEGDVVRLDMMGNPVTFVREGAEAPTALVENGGRPEEAESELIPVLSAKAFDIYYLKELESGGTVMKALEMGMDPGNTSLQINKDGSGALTIMGNETKMDFASGKITMGGMDLYTYTLIGSDEIDIDMMGNVYKFVKEGSQAAVDAGLVEGAVGTVKKYVNYRHLMAGETQMDVDGGVLYYEVFSNEACISYGYVDAKNLYIPAEIEGKPVTTIRRLHGNIENLYLPSSLQHIYASFGDFEGLKNLVFGYDGNGCSLKKITQGCCDYGHFKRDKLEKVVFPESMATNEDFTLGKSSFGEAFNLSVVENIPPVWKEGADSLDKAVAMMGDPQNYIHPTSDKVKKVAEEVTKGLSTDREKVYAICKYVVDTLVYDHAGYGKYLAAREAQYYGADYDKSDIVMGDVATYPDEVLDKKVAVCEGFSRLTRAMCNAVGIPAVLMVGVMPPKKADWEMANWHAWNMIYFDGAWRHVDTTFCNKDYNSLMVVDRESGELAEVIWKESAITYDEYMNNPELQAAYTWEDIQAINQDTVDKNGFDAKHYYFDLPSLAMGADHIAYSVDDVVIPGVNPLK